MPKMEPIPVGELSTRLSKAGRRHDPAQPSKDVEQQRGS